MYWSTSNAGPWGGQARGNDSSDIGPYTNLWTSSQLAFNADTGKIVWGYQMTPSDVWDFDGINEGVLADIAIGGSKQPVLMKADRNGFFYVINRQSGKLLSRGTVRVLNWAKKVDLSTGMPVEDPAKRPRLGVWARNVCPEPDRRQELGADVFQPARTARSPFPPSICAWTSPAGRRAHPRQVLPGLRVQPRHWRATAAPTCLSSSPGTR